MRILPSFQRKLEPRTFSARSANLRRYAPFGYDLDSSFCWNDEVVNHKYEFTVTST